MQLDALLGALKTVLCSSSVDRRAPRLCPEPSVSIWPRRGGATVTRPDPARNRPWPLWRSSHPRAANCRCQPKAIHYRFQLRAPQTILVTHRPRGSGRCQPIVTNCRGQPRAIQCRWTRHGQPRAIHCRWTRHAPRNSRYVEVARASSTKRAGSTGSSQTACVSTLLRLRQWPTAPSDRRFGNVLTCPEMPCHQGDATTIGFRSSAFAPSLPHRQRLPPTRSLATSILLAEAPLTAVPCCRRPMVAGRGSMRPNSVLSGDHRGRHPRSTGCRQGDRRQRPLAEHYHSGLRPPAPGATITTDGN